MKIRKGIYGGIFIVFSDEYTASKYQWFFYTILRRKWASFGGYMNAYELF